MEPLLQVSAKGAKGDIDANFSAEGIRIEDVM